MLNYCLYICLDFGIQNPGLCLVHKKSIGFFFCALTYFYPLWTVDLDIHDFSKEGKALDIHAMPSFFILILGADILSLAHLSYGFDLCIIMMTIMMHWCASCLLVCHAQIKGKVRSWVSPWKSFSTFSASLTPF